MSTVPSATVLSPTSSSNRRRILNDIRQRLDALKLSTKNTDSSDSTTTTPACSTDSWETCNPHRSIYDRKIASEELENNPIVPNKSNENAVPSQQHQSTTTTTRMDIEKIRNSTVCKIFVDDYTDDDFWLLLDALNSNTVVTKVVVFRKRRSDGKRIRYDDDLDYLFHILRRTGGDGSSTLSELHLWSFTQQDLASLSLGLVDHPTIMYVQLHMSQGTLNETTAKAFATMPHLISLELEVNDSFPLWPMATSRTLSVLSIVSTNFTWKTHHIMPFADRLQRNQVLTVLDLEPELSCDCLTTILSSLRSSIMSSSSSTTNTTYNNNNNPCPLDTLQFNVQTNDPSEGDECINELLKLIDVSPQLRVVWNHRYESFVVSSNSTQLSSSLDHHHHHLNTKILNTIQSSSSLEQFHVFVEKEDFCRTKCNILDQKITSRVV